MHAHQKKSQWRQMLNINPATSHPYIIAQNKKKLNYLNHNNNNNNQYQSTLASNDRNRKRKYVESFEDNEQRHELLQYEPQKKQHITEQTMIQSIRDECVSNNNNIDLNSVDHTLNALCLHNFNGKKRRSKKRKYDEINNECKENYNCNVNELCYNINKKMKLWDAKNNKSYSYLLHNKNNEFMNDMNEINETIENENVNTNTVTNDTNDIGLQLIPDIIQYAHFLNNGNAFVTKLCRTSALQKTKLNKYTGAIVKYEKPKMETNMPWRELIQKYYENNEIDVSDNDCEMDEKNKRRRPIRLHTSYTGFSRTNLINTEQLKKIANKCYVSSVKGNKNNKYEEQNDDSMDCD